MGEKTISDLREDYQQGELIEANIPEDPILLFKDWFEAAQKSDIPEPNAMTLATASKEGVPSARIVLLKGIEESGFIFYTNYESRKGQEIASNPLGALVFLWKEMERQVRIEGTILKLDESQSTKYFQSRPKGSQIGAWASPQSQIIQDRSILVDQYNSLDIQYANQQQLPKPPNWGGYTINPKMIEFWQGRSSRLHDRLRYTKHSSGWSIDRLAP